MSFFSYNFFRDLHDEATGLSRKTTTDGYLSGSGKGGGDGQMPRKTLPRQTYLNTSSLSMASDLSTSFLQKNSAATMHCEAYLA